MSLEPEAVDAQKQLLLSVVLCTFNGKRYLREQVLSIVEQGRRPDQLVVCDDCSSDGTPELLAELLRTSDLDYHIHKNEVRLGISGNFEQAIRLCHGDIIVFSDQDDVWRPDRLAQVERAFIDHPQATMVFSDARVIDALGAPLGYTQWESSLFGRRMRAKHRGDLLPVLLRYPVVCGATMAVDRNMAQNCLPIADEWLHDEWISLLCAATSTVHVLEQDLLSYRVHERQEIGAARPTLKRQIATAKTMDARHFERQVRRFSRLAERLAAWRPAPNAQVLEALKGKIAYLEARVRILQGSRNPWIASTRLLLNGSHQRFAMGIKSWLHDIGHEVLLRVSPD